MKIILVGTKFTLTILREAKLIYYKHAKINKELNHLSDGQINELIDKYLGKKIKVNELITEFKLDIKPNKICSILPPVIIDEKCEYCKSNMISSLENRNGLSPIKSCPVCGHMVYEYTRYLQFDKTVECHCDNCIKKKQQEIEEKILKIESVYAISNPKINFSDLDLKEKVILVETIKNDSVPSYSLIQPCIENLSYSFNGEHLLRNINFMLHSGIISISPENGIDVFEVFDNFRDFYDKNFPYTVNIRRATFNINVDFSQKEKNMIFNNTVFNKIDNGKYELLIEYIYYSTIQLFRKILEYNEVYIYKG